MDINEDNSSLKRCGSPDIRGRKELALNKARDTLKTWQEKLRIIQLDLNMIREVQERSAAGSKLAKHFHPKTTEHELTVEMEAIRRQINTTKCLIEQLEHETMSPKCNFITEMKGKLIPLITQFKCLSKKYESNIKDLLFSNVHLYPNNSYGGENLKTEDNLMANVIKEMKFLFTKGDKNVDDNFCLQEIETKNTTNTSREINFSDTSDLNELDVFNIEDSYINLNENTSDIYHTTGNYNVATKSSNKSSGNFSESLLNINVTPYSTNDERHKYYYQNQIKLHDIELEKDMIEFDSPEIKNELQNIKIWDKSLSEGNAKSETEVIKLDRPCIENEEIPTDVCSENTEIIYLTKTENDRKSIEFRSKVYTLPDEILIDSSINTETENCAETNEYSCDNETILEIGSPEVDNLERCIEVYNSKYNTVRKMTSDSLGCDIAEVEELVESEVDEVMSGLARLIGCVVGIDRGTSREAALSALNVLNTVAHSLATDHGASVTSALVPVHKRADTAAEDQQHTSETTE